MFPLKILKVVGPIVHFQPALQFSADHWLNLRLNGPLNFSHHVAIGPEAFFDQTQASRQLPGSTIPSPQTSIGI